VSRFDYTNLSALAAAKTSHRQNTPAQKHHSAKAARPQQAGAK